MMIKMKTLTGKEIEVDIDASDKIERIKERVEEKEGIANTFLSKFYNFLRSISQTFFLHNNVSDSVESK